MLFRSGIDIYVTLPVRVGRPFFYESFFLSLAHLDGFRPCLIFFIRTVSLTSYVDAPVFILLLQCLKKEICCCFNFSFYALVGIRPCYTFFFMGI